MATTTAVGDVPAMGSAVFKMASAGGIDDEDDDMTSEESKQVENVGDDGEEEEDEEAFQGLSADADGVDYVKGAQYWANCEPTVDAMLGGFAKISGRDIAGSQQFMSDLFMMPNAPGKSRAVDCGAGIGRITRQFLQLRFDKVDLVEQCPKFLEEAKSSLKSSKVVDRFICCGLQDFRPEPGTYDVVWCQWVVGFLTDDDLVRFLQRCSVGLKPNGVIVLKDNTTRTYDLDFDDADGSVTRPVDLFKTIFKRAGLTIVKERRQLKFPKCLYPVYMYALRPSQTSNNNNKNVLGDS